MSKSDYALDDWFDPVKFGDFDHPFVIAGGCLRDTYFGKDVVDVDVFIGIEKYKMDQIRGNKRFLLIASGPADKDPYMFITNYDDAHDSDDRVFEVDGDPDYPEAGFVSGRCSEIPGLNIILKEIDPDDGVAEMVEEMFKTFPCSISKIAYSPMEDKLYVDDSFYESVSTNTIQFYDADEKYIKKIMPKYKEFKQVYNSTCMATIPIRSHVGGAWTVGYGIRSTS